MALLERSAAKNEILVGDKWNDTAAYIRGTGFEWVAPDKETYYVLQAGPSTIAGFLTICPSMSLPTSGGSVRQRDHRAYAHKRSSSPLMASATPVLLN